MFEIFLAFKVKHKIKLVAMLAMTYNGTIKILFGCQLHEGGNRKKEKHTQYMLNLFLNALHLHSVAASDC